MGMPGDLLFRPLIEIAQALRDKEVTAQELVEAAIDMARRGHGSVTVGSASYLSRLSPLI
jgi:hypothetical protein